MSLRARGEFAVPPELKDSCPYAFRMVFEQLKSPFDTLEITKGTRVGFTGVMSMSGRLGFSAKFLPSVGSNGSDPDPDSRGSIHRQGQVAGGLSLTNACETNKALDAGTCGTFERIQQDTSTIPMTGPLLNDDLEGRQSRAIWRAMKHMPLFQKSWSKVTEGIWLATPARRFLCHRLMNHLIHTDSGGGWPLQTWAGSFCRVPFHRFCVGVQLMIWVSRD